VLVRVWRGAFSPEGGMGVDDVAARGHWPRLGTLETGQG